MKKIFLIAAVILAIVCFSAGCINSGGDVTATPTEIPTVTSVPTQTPDSDDAIIGTWQSTESYQITNQFTYSYQLKFNADGTCVETDTWSDGDEVYWIGSWEKTGDGKYRYELGHMYVVSDDGTTLTDSYGYTIPGNGFIGTWTETDKSRGTYLEYVFTSDGKGTRTVYKMSGEVYDLMSLDWIEIDNGIYKVYYTEPSYSELELESSTSLHDTTNNQYLTKI